MRRKEPGTVAIIIDGDRLLLHLRRDHKKWGLPGGSADFGESFETAVRREVREETGLEVEVVRVRGVYSNPKNTYFHTQMLVEFMDLW